MNVMHVMNLIIEYAMFWYAANQDPIVRSTFVRAGTQNCPRPIGSGLNCPDTNLRGQLTWSPESLCPRTQLFRLNVLEPICTGAHLLGTHLSKNPAPRPVISILCPDPLCHLLQPKSLNTEVGIASHKSCTARPRASVKFWIILIDSMLKQHWTSAQNQLPKQIKYAT